MSGVSPKRNVRKSVIAGSWYPGKAIDLTRTINHFLSEVPADPVSGRLVGLVSPHAGYVYSGQTAAYAYKQLEGRHYDVVVVVSPVHRMYVAPVMVNDCAYYETPLGLVEVDRDLFGQLERRIDLAGVEWDDEHSLEIQLPFLQRLLGDFKLLPVMQGDQSMPTCQALSDALAAILQDKQALLVASTDLSHFHRYDAAIKLDDVTSRAIEEYDPLGLGRALEQRTTEACGGGPVITVMLASRERGANRAQVLHYENSGDVTGDKSRVVGYLAAALYEAGD